MFITQYNIYISYINGIYWYYFPKARTLHAAQYILTSCLPVWLQRFSKKKNNNKYVNGCLYTYYLPSCERCQRMNYLTISHITAILCGIDPGRVFTTLPQSIFYYLKIKMSAVITDVHDWILTLQTRCTYLRYTHLPALCSIILYRMSAESNLNRNNR